MGNVLTALKIFQMTKPGRAGKAAHGPDLFSLLLERIRTWTPSSAWHKLEEGKGRANMQMVSCPWVTVALMWGWWQQEPGHEAVAQLAACRYLKHPEDSKQAGGDPVRDLKPGSWPRGEVGTSVGHRKRERELQEAGLIQRGLGGGRVSRSWVGHSRTSQYSKGREESDPEQDHQWAQL